MAWFEIIANNIEVAFACMCLSEKVMAGTKAAIKFFKTPTTENAQALKDATAEAEASGEAQDAVAEEADESNPGAEAMEISQLKLRQRKRQRRPRLQKQSLQQK